MVTIVRGRFHAAATTATTAVDMRAIEREAHRLRAEALRDVLDGLRTWLARHLFALDWRASHAADPLYSMSDRELADIGISRADIDSVAAGTYEDSHGRMVPPRPERERPHAA